MDVGVAVDSSVGIERGVLVRCKGVDVLALGAMEAGTFLGPHAVANKMNVMRKSCTHFMDNPYS